jgi:hypothetical protein
MAPLIYLLLMTGLSLDAGFIFFTFTQQVLVCLFCPFLAAFSFLLIGSAAFNFSFFA